MSRRLPPLSAIRAFEAAARHLSFKLAAAELGVTPTAITHQVQTLEDYCARKLFQRRPRPLSLTQAGLELFPVLQTGLDAFAAVIGSINGEAARQPLKVTCTNAFAHRWLIPRLALWRRAYPDTALEIIGTDAVMNLQAGDADVAIRYQFARPAGLVSLELCRDRFWLVCSPTLQAAGLPMIRPSDIWRHTLIHAEWGASERQAPTWSRWLEAATTAGLRIGDVTLCNNLFFREELHAIEAAIAGEGLAICSDVLTKIELESGALIKLFDLALPGFGFYVTYSAAHPRKESIQDFLNWLRSVV